MIRILTTVTILTVMLTACGNGNGGENAATTTTMGQPTTTSATPPTSTTEPADHREQPAIWPAPHVVFDTAEEAAEDFVSKVLDVEPVLGDFLAGDSRSGEIEIFFPGEGNSANAVSRGTMLMRQLGPDNGWFVLGVVNNLVTITSPEAADNVPAGPIVIEGQALGFEGNVIVTALLIGENNTQLDQANTQAGSLGTPGPFSVTLDFSRAAPGDTIAILVRGGTGLSSDPGEVGALAVSISN